MKPLDIFHTWFIIYVIVTKTMITFRNTFNFYFTEEQKATVLRGTFSPLSYLYAIMLIFIIIYTYSWYIHSHMSENERHKLSV